MDYEKKYKEALNRASKLKVQNPFDTVSQMMEHIFPELKESADDKDEKIRKTLIEMVRDTTTDVFRYYKVDKKLVLAWLEKQGEKKTAIEAWKEMRLEVYAQASGNRHEPNCSNDKTKMFSLSDIDEIIEKISEQKPSDKIEQEYHCNGVREPKEATGVLKQLLNKENHAWSEEDEAGFADTLWAIQQARTIAKDENDMGNLWYAEHWLKSIKDRVQPQPKQEWSEEDMSKVQRIREYLNEAKKYYADITEVRECMEWLDTLKDKVQPNPIAWSEEDKNILDTIIYTVENKNCIGVPNEIMVNWLKSIKNKYSWKPSEKQMNALDSTVQYGKVSRFQYEHLNSLFNDLKKLN